jgi:hypothetical protein
MGQIWSHTAQQSLTAKELADSRNRMKNNRLKEELATIRHLQNVKEDEARLTERSLTPILIKKVQPILVKRIK